MRVFELGRYNIPDEIIEAWISQIGEELLPVQERAIKRYGVLDGKSLIISSPTTSGKTFVGEIAAIKGVMEKKKVIYLVPLKSLAEEKYLDFQRKYEKFGIKTVISSSDYREYDQMIEDGDFGIAIIVYEKMAQLLIKNPFLLKNIALIIIDELQEIGDPHRGPGLEITLTKIVTSPYKPQILGLSAVLGNTESLARWLKTDFLFHDKRPVELYEGVLYKGIFHYKTYNTFEKKQEQLIDIPPKEQRDASKILLRSVLHLANLGEQILVFLPSKRDTMNFAFNLSRMVDFPEAEDAIKELMILEDTSLKNLLMDCLRSSVAFHHADLSRDEREVIERYTRKGILRVICCTTTLALGVNLPASAVFLDIHKWEYDEKTDSLISTPISWAEYENISGRAGRLGFGKDFGRSITIATNDYEYRMLWQNYIEGEEEILKSQLNAKGLEDYLISILASGNAETRDQLEEFLLNTYMGQSEGIESIRENLDRSLKTLKRYRLIEEDRRGRINISSIGSVVALKGISCATADDLSFFLRDAKDRSVSDLEILHAAASSEDGRRIYLQMAKREHLSGKYEYMLKKRFSGQEDYIGSLLSRDIKSEILLSKTRAKAVKLALLLERWIQGKDTPSIERDFESYYGTIASAGEAMSWILDSASLIAKAVGAPGELQKRLSILSERLLYGVPEEGLELARLRVKGLGRAGIKRLITEGFDSIKAVHEVPLSLLSRVIPEKIAINLKEAVDKRLGIKKDELAGETEEEKSYLCSDQIEITGVPLKKRTKIFINGCALGITTRSLEILLRFAVALKKDGKGWIHKEDISTNTAVTQLISRLRSELRDYTIKRDGSIIENDGSGYYRLSVPPDNVIIDKESLSRHWSLNIRKIINRFEDE